MQRVFHRNTKFVCLSFSLEIGSEHLQNESRGQISKSLGSSPFIQKRKTKQNNNSNIVQKLFRCHDDNTITKKIARRPTWVENLLHAANIDYGTNTYSIQACIKKTSLWWWSPISPYSLIKQVKLSYEACRIQPMWLHTGTCASASMDLMARNPRLVDIIPLFRFMRDTTRINTLCHRNAGFKLNFAFAVCTSFLQQINKGGIFLKNYGAA